MAKLRPVPAPETQRRAREVERRLAAYGFALSTHRFRPAGPPADADAADAAVRLREALAGLGPVFAAFGRYLGSRADLLPIAHCLVLAGIPDAGEAAPSGAVAERIETELGAPLLELFASFEEEPFETRLLYQSHRAWLAAGEEVTVRVVPPGLEERLELDAGLLALLRPALPGLPLDEAVAGFRQALADETDFILQAEALEVLGRNAAADFLAVPEVHRRLTSARVLTLRPLLGEPLEASASGRAGEGDEAAAYDLARRIHRFWLRQALTSRKLPVEARLVRLAGGRLGCAGGAFADVHGASQANLWDYLRATAAHDPERVFACLARELAAPPQGEVRGDLRKRLRQVVPFREQALSASRESLIEHLMTHWRLIRECGYRPLPHLQDFYRGLFWAARTGWRLAPAEDPLRDPLRDALDDLEWRAGWSQFEQLADPQRMAQMFEGYFATLAVLPQQIEQALDGLARDGAAAPALGAPRRARRRSRNSAAAVTALGLAMAGTALVTARLATLPGGPGELAEKVGALIFLLLGALMLWITRSRPRAGMSLE